MKIGIIGGTGDIGEGMAMRLSPKFDVIVGSREKEKADASCESCIGTLAKRGQECSLSGECNQGVVDQADVIILAIPFKHLFLTVHGLTGFAGKIVVSPINPMEKGEFFACTPPEEGSAALMVRRLLPDAKVCTAFNAIAANKWRALDESLSYSVPVCGNDAEAKRQVMGIVNQVSQLQAFDAGPLAASCLVESLTPLLLNIARYNKLRDVGVRFV